MREERCEGEVMVVGSAAMVVLERKGGWEQFACSIDGVLRLST